MVSIIALILTMICRGPLARGPGALCRAGGGSRGPAGLVCGGWGGEAYPPSRWELLGLVMRSDPLSEFYINF